MSPDLSRGERAPALRAVRAPDRCGRGECRRVGVLLALVAVCLLLGGIPGESGAAPLAHREVLPSGMVLLVAERPAVPVVTATLVLQAGAVFDPPQKPGVANLTALMLTQGTRTRSAPEISEAIEFVGGSLDVASSLDTTRLSFSVLSKDLDLALDLMGDLLTNPTFPPVEFAKKVPEVLVGIKRRQEDPGAVSTETFSALVYGSHPYGRPSQGTEASVSTITREDLVAFYQGRYRPNGAILAVVGDVRLAELKQRLEARLRGWMPGGLPPVAPAGPTPLAARETKSVQRTVTQASIVFGHPGITRDNPDYYAVFVMNYILGGGFNSRIMQKIREEKGWAYDAGSGFFAGKYAGDFSVSLQTKNETAGEAIEAALAEVRRIREQPVSERELSDAKAYLTGSFPMRLDTSAKLVGMLASIEQNNLGLDYVDRFPRIINAITTADIQRVARQYLDPAHIALAVVADLTMARIPE
jgi:zinc protease